jgi:hypothetical protein
MRSCYLRTALFWVITQPVVEISYRRFGTTYRSLLQWPRMVPKGCPETSVMNYHYSLRNNQEYRSSHLLRGGSRKSRKPLLTRSAKKFPYFVEPEVSLPKSSVPATCPCPGPGQFSPCPPNRHLRLWSWYSYFKVNPCCFVYRAADIYMHRNTVKRYA